jgi:hypothetical protein
MATVTETKIVLPDGTGVTIFFDVKLAKGEKTNGKYHGGIDGYTVVDVVPLGSKQLVFVE